MQVVTVDDGSGLPAASVAPAQQLPPDSDYSTDVAHSHVFDPSMEAIGQVNNILCMVSQTASDQMVNVGPYNAQIDTAKCEDGGNDSSQGQSSGSNAVQPELWVVDSSRADNKSPQIVNVWINEEDDGSPQLIQAQMVIHSGADEVNPFGDFMLNFAGIPNGGSILNPRMWGSLATLDAAGNQLGFSLFQAKGDVNQLPLLGEEAGMTAVSVEMSSDQTTGEARVLSSWRRNDPFSGDSGIVNDEYRIAFDDVDVLRGHVGDPAVCLSHTQFHKSTWRYNLYDATTGDRVSLNSGFPFKTASGEHGWLGYWGMWAPNGVTIDAGDVITKEEYGNQTTTAYTVVKAPGKLIKHTRNTLDLADAEGESFEWFDFNQMPPARVRVQCVLGLFYETEIWSDDTQSWSTIGVPTLIDTSALGYLQMWSPSLGGSVSYVDGDTFVTYFAQEFVNGSSDLFTNAIGGIAQLYGYVNCLRSTMTANDAELGDIYLPNAPDAATPYIFQVDHDDLTLMHDTDGSGTLLTQVGLADGEVPGFGPFTWGMSSGPMVTDPNAIVNIWDVWSQDVFYTYETGANPWNQYTSAVDANGDYVVFDAPIQFTYTHTTAADANDDATYDQHKYLLSYGGEGDLWGIPNEGIDFNGDGNFDRFVPLFSIADGTAMGPTGIEYLVRAIDSELALEDDPAGCATLDLIGAAALPLPDGTGFVSPDIGAQPVVTDPPAVIEGKVQGQ